MGSTVTISLISLNQRDDLARLLPSLMPAAQRVQAEILLVNNRSLDGTQSFIEENYPSIRVSDNQAKAGYGANHNINIKQATGAYTVIMNSDMTVSENVFECLRDYLDTHPDVGMVTPKILNPDGSIQPLNKRYPTLLDLALRRFASKSMERRFADRMARYEMLDVGYENECEVPCLSGCFLFSRTSVLRAVGGFDERYFLYFEDFDLSRRVQKTHRTMFYPEASATHYWQRGAHKKLRHSMYFVKSAIRYFNRWGYRLW